MLLLAITTQYIVADFAFFSKFCLETVVWVIPPSVGFSGWFTALLTVVLHIILMWKDLEEFYCIGSGLIEKRICVLISL